jgi:fibronectin-binding autotransporter adhesin
MTRRTTTFQGTRLSKRPSHQRLSYQNPAAIRRSWASIVEHLCFCILAFVLTVKGAQAQTLYYDTNNGTGVQSGNGIWSTSVNDWNTLPSPPSGGRVVWTNGLNAAFTTGGVNTLTLNGTVSTLSITQSGTGTNTIINAGTSPLLNIGSGGLTNTSDLAFTINSPIGLTATQIWTATSGGGTLAVTGGIATGGNNLTIQGTGNTTISTGAITGGGTLTKSGTGIFTLNSTSDSTTVNVNSGTLALGANDRLANGATVTVAGGILDTTASNRTDTVSIFNMSSGSLNGGGTLTATTYGLSGGTVNGNLGTGTVNVTTGTVNLNGTAAATTVNVNSGTLLLGSSDRLANAAAVNVAGGILSIAGNSDTVGTVTLTNGSITGNTGVLTGSSYAVQNGTISAILGGTASLTKSTGGTVTLSGANTYSGNTSLSTGTLLVNNTTGSATGTGSVTTDFGTFLAGSGRIAPGSGNAINMNGTLIIGQDGVGTAQDLEIALSNAATTLTTTSILKFDLFSGYNSGNINGASSADSLNFTGLLGTTAVTLAGNLDFTFVGGQPTVTPGNYAAGSSWQLFAWTGITSVSGTYGPSNINGLPDLSSLNLDWNTDDLYTTGRLSIVFVPEPRMTSLIWLGLLATQLRRRRSSPKVLI